MTFDELSWFSFWPVASHLPVKIRHRKNAAFQTGRKVNKVALAWLNIDSIDTGELSLTWAPLGQVAEDRPL